MYILHVKIQMNDSIKYESKGLDCNSMFNNAFEALQSKKKIFCGILNGIVAHLHVAWDVSFTIVLIKLAPRTRMRRRQKKI